MRVNGRGIKDIRHVLSDDGLLYTKCVRLSTLRLILLLGVLSTCLGSMSTKDEEVALLPWRPTSNMQWAN